MAIKRYGEASSLLPGEAFVVAGRFRASSASNVLKCAMPVDAKHLEPRWPAMVALLAVGGLRLALPSSLAVGPDWLFLVVLGVLILLYGLAGLLGRYGFSTVLGYLLVALVTADMSWSLGLLVAGLPSHQQTPIVLLRSAAALWCTNIIVFASWYWRLDAGGPHAREQRESIAMARSCSRKWRSARKPGEKCARTPGPRVSSITCSWPSIPVPRSRPRTAPSSPAGPRC